ncbi:TolC family protein [Synechococcus sp. RSCCF101]|uniref:TolC family protein n=1 Tax=Synechococcus sp. RSCCF101 TaxID=2511069 RepID=UPI001CD9780F|nr:TolC family protein [Synechococcus sp. RSCCF101]
MIPAGSTPPETDSAEAAPEDAVSVPTRVPLAPEVKGERPQADPSLLPPAATDLTPALEGLNSPPSLALPTSPDQVTITELRPLGLIEVERLAEVNNPNLKAVAAQVEQARSELRASEAAWYPQVNIFSDSLPSYTRGDAFTFAPAGIDSNPFTGLPTTTNTETYTRTGTYDIGVGVQVDWDLINPQRVPQIAAARDSFERSRNAYLIALRELRLQANQAYFELQQADEQVRIGQQSVRASLVSLKDARARFQAGVATKLEVLEAETQLARDQQLLTNAEAAQSISRRSLAGLLDLPSNVTPTAKEPSKVVGAWMPSLQESIIAAYAFREELNQAILDISIANSNANSAIGAVQPFLTIVNTFSSSRSVGQSNTTRDTIDYAPYTWSAQNTVGLQLSWNIFDGGRARALYRASKYAAEESTFNFATQRDSIRQQVETSFFTLKQNTEDIATAAREVTSARESLRLARLRFQAGVTTQREVVDNQRDLTQAEVRYANAVASYNISLAELRRRTGLDQIQLCVPQNLPAERPVVDEADTVPVEPRPLQPACQLAAQPF